MQKFKIRAIWDDAGEAWSVDNTNIPGLAAEAETRSEMLEMLKELTHELLEGNCPEYADQPVSVEIDMITRESFFLFPRNIGD